MREMFDGFDPSREPLRPVDQARMAWTASNSLTPLALCLIFTHIFVLAPLAPF